jgi:hypothetical protein
MKALGRRVPTDWKHLDRYPLTAMTAPQAPVPVVIGVNWYVEFDKPVKDSAGHWWIAHDGKLTRVRGGHCVCLKPRSRSDPPEWWSFYDQGQEGACVGFGSARMMSLLNRRRYDARWLYHEAQKMDEWPGEDYDGTSVRAAMDVLRTEGLKTPHGNVRASAGIQANRWADSVHDVLNVLGTPQRDYVEVLNSWGRDYPHYVRMPASVLERLRSEDGEVAVVTDR